jgi:hypothetical protein
MQPCTGSVRRVDVAGQELAIFEANHSSAPLLKIARTPLDSTGNVAVGTVRAVHPEALLRLTLRARVPECARLR